MSEKAAADYPVLVFAHYFGGSARSWAPLLISLNGIFDSIAPDLPGFGGTPNLAGDLDLDTYVDHFAALAGDRPWIAVGHSMGGKIALGAAVRSPNLRGLILIAPSPPTPEPMSEADRQMSLASHGDRLRAREIVLRSCNAPLTPPTFDAAVEDQLRVEAVAWRWWLERGSREDISSRTPMIDAPTLVLFGNADRVLGSAVPNALADQIRDARSIGFAGGGHFIPLEQPAAIAERITHFVFETCDP